MTTAPGLLDSLGRRPQPTSLRAGTVLAAFTTVRLALIPPVIASFMVYPAVTAVCLGGFMFADLVDGILARRFDADGPKRRALDSAIDRIAIDACFVGAYAVGALPLLLLLGFLARDLYCSALCVWMFRQRRAAIQADVWYRGLSFLIAVWALAAPWMTQPQRNASVALLLGIALVLAADLTRGVRRVIQSPLDLTGYVIPARRLRPKRAGRRARLAVPVRVP